MSGDAWRSASVSVVDEASDLDVAVADRAIAEVGEEEPALVGTLFFMILFLLVMVGLWVTVYWMLLER